MAHFERNGGSLSPEYALNVDELNLRAQFEIDAAGKSAKKRKELEEQLQRDIQLLRDKAALAQLINDEKQLDNLRVIAVLYHRTTTDIDKAITENQLEQSKKRVAIAKGEAGAKDEIARQNFEDAQKYEQAATEVISGIVGGSFDRKKNAIQDEIDLNQKKTQQEIDAVNRSVLSEQDKANKIAIINATAQTKKEQLELRQRKLDQERARFEKALGIIQALQAIAVALKDKDFPAVALATATLIKLVATPIPRFRSGKDKSNKYQGAAIVDDGGKTEPILRADGQIELSGSATPRLTYVNRDDIVFPSVEAMLSKVAMPKIPVPGDKMDKSVQEIKAMADKIEKAIDRIPDHMPASTQITKAGWRKTNKDLDDEQDWIRRIMD